jgi:hypothetical protein
MLDFVDLVAEGDPSRRAALVHAFIEEFRTLGDAIRLDAAIKALKQKSRWPGDGELLPVANPYRISTWQPNVRRRVGLTECAAPDCDERHGRL